MSIKKTCRILMLFAAMFTVSVAHGEQAGGVEFSGTGFLTVGIGKMLGGTRNIVDDYNCPCFISDYAQAGVYDGRNGLQWRPDSKLGLQGAASLDNQRYSVTAQVVARGADNGNVGLEWLYGSYKPNDNITIQAGRKRLPMFYYSDVQDVGIALPWTHLPPGPYGWEAVNYNGINVRYQDQWSGWSAAANLLVGSESKKDSGYWKVFGMGRQSRSDIKWSNIVGGDLTLVKDWLETRVGYIQSDTQENLVSAGWDTTSQTYIVPAGVILPPAKQQIYGLTVNADYQNWLLRTEFIQINHPGLNYRDHAQLVGIGYRYGKWQPLATWSEYRGTAVTDGVLPGVTPFIPNMQQTISLTLRYDLTISSALKAQYDSQTDHSDPGYQPNYGSSRLITLSYDVIF